MLFLTRWQKSSMMAIHKTVQQILYIYIYLCNWIKPNMQCNGVQKHAWWRQAVRPIWAYIAWAYSKCVPAQVEIRHKVLMLLHAWHFTCFATEQKERCTIKNNRSPIYIGRMQDTSFTIFPPGRKPLRLCWEKKTRFASPSHL